MLRMFFFTLLLISSFTLTLHTFAAPSTTDDLFQVKQIKEKQAIVEGKPKAIKVGDSLYFPRPPYKFTIEAIRGNEITITLPESHSLTTGSSLVRTPSNIIKSYLDQEGRLKRALED